MQGLYNANHGITSQDGNTVKFHVITTGNSVNLCLKVKEPGAGRLRFEAEPTSFEMDLAEFTPTPQRLFEAPIDQFLEVQTAPIGRLPWSLDFAFDAPAPHRAEMPYFVRVRQLDESKAWSSPVYVTKG